MNTKVWNGAMAALNGLALGILSNKEFTLGVGLWMAGTAILLLYFLACTYFAEETK